MQNITKEFPGVKALDNVNIEVTEGEIHALCGENGAGKSTLMKVLSGIHVYGSYDGSVIYQGKECHFKNIKDSEKEGIVIIHQELALVPYLSIAENMFLGNEQANHGVINWDLTNKKAAEYMAMVGLSDSPTTLIKDIGMGKQQLVEIAKALAKNVKLLILDEPTSSLNESDAKKLLDLLIEFKETKGITSIIISHKLNEISYCADKITVIRDGQSIETLVKGVDELSEERIIKGMVGREMTNRYPAREHNIGDVALEVKNWTVYHPVYANRKMVDNVSINVRHGEVVGFAGLIGAGRTELAMSVFGRAYGTKISGEVLLNGKPVHLKDIPHAIEAGLAYVTEDRKGDGLILTDSIKHNTTLARPAFISKKGVIDKDMEKNKAEDIRYKLGVKTPSVEQNVGNLSGGNQQKIVIAKWLLNEPDVIILDEPTRGIDVGAKRDIYLLLGQLVQQGKAVIMISSEIPELMGICDRIMVMCEGNYSGEVKREEFSQERIMTLASAIKV